MHGLILSVLYYLFLWQTTFGSDLNEKVSNYYYMVEE